MAIVNSLLNVKDSRWLQLEVCREFQRNKCTRPDSECKFAHPAANVEIQNGRVIACYDSIKGRCNREKPPCKYFHPPKHLKDQLIINGKNHLALKNALLQQVPFQTVLAGQLPIAPSPYLTNLPAIAAASSAAAYGAYAAPNHNATAAMLLGHDQFPSSYGLNSPSPTTSSAVSSPSASNKSRVDANIGNNNNGASIESHVLAEASSLNAVANVAAAAAAAGRKRTRETNEELLMQISGAYPISKRPALDKNGAPLYHGATTAAYPQPFAMHQPFVPLSFYFPLVGQSNTIPRY